MAGENLETDRNALETGRAMITGDGCNRKSNIKAMSLIEADKKDG